MKDIIKKAGITAGIIFTTSNLYCQYHEKIEVEGKYEPEIILQERLNVYPERVRFTMKEEPLQADEDGIEADFPNVLYPMAATGWKTSRQFSDYKGYLFFGAGSWLNSTLSAGYRYIDDKNRTAGIKFQHNSTSLWHPKVVGVKTSGRQYRYDEEIGIYASCMIKDAGRLGSSFDYGIDFFNYYGTINKWAIDNPVFSGEQPQLPGQILNRVNWNVNWTGNQKPGNTLTYNVGFGLNYSGFRNLYLPLDGTPEKDKGLKETKLELSADTRFPWGNGSGGVVGDLNLLFYGGPNEVNSIFDNTPFSSEIYTLTKVDNYGMLTLRPYYLWHPGGFDVKIGFDIDLTVNAGWSGNHYPFFHVAPDLSANYREGKLNLWATITGGSSLNTISSEREKDYYMMPWLTSTRPVYTPFDGKIGFEVGSFGGFKAGLEFGYKFNRGVRLGGWYQTLINYGFHPINGLEGVTHNNSDILYSFDIQGINLHGGKIEGWLGYRYEDLIDIKIKGGWQPQKRNLGYFNGYDRPRVTADFNLSVRPIRKLKIDLDYSYRGVRRIYTRVIADPFEEGGIIEGRPLDNLVSYRLPDLTMLNFSASWRFTDTFTVWLKADNLLNRHDEYLPMLPAQGINILAGLNFIF